MPHSPSGLGTLPVGSRVPPITETSTLMQKTTPRPSQQLVQTSPPLDKHVFASVTRPILIHHAEESSLLASPPTSQEIPAPQQDRASAESELLTSQEPSTSTMEQHPVSETAIHQVKPVLGTTPMENW